jgi:transposase
VVPTLKTSAGAVTGNTSKIPVPERGARELTEPSPTPKPSRRWGLQKSCRRHPDEPKDHALGRSRGGFGSKFHLVTDGRGLPLKVEVTAGQVHDSMCVESAMDQIAIPQPVGRPRKRPKQLAGDKGYSFNRVRDWLRKYGIKPLIPRKDNEKLRHDGRSIFDKQAYKRRNIVEHPRRRSGVGRGHL